MPTPAEGFILKEKVAALAAVILSKHPSLPGLLQEIHVTLKANPEQVTILSEEDIAIIFNGLEHQTKNFLLDSISSGTKTKSTAAKLKNDTLGALGG